MTASASVHAILPHTIPDVEQMGRGAMPAPPGGFIKMIVVNSGAGAMETAYAAEV